MKRSKETAIYKRPVVTIVAGKFVTCINSEQVRVMMRAEGYAMVRLPGCMPFVVSERELVWDARKGKTG